MSVQAKVILDSISPDGVRLTTLEVTFHRFVLAEFNTHRVFSRNSASSRAIPVEKQLARVVAEPAWPVEWPAEQRGMQGGAELEGPNLAAARELFEDVHAYTTERIARYLEENPDKSQRLHKSLVNRLLEPFMWHTVIVTATEFDGFWTQRISELAQPEIHVAALAMWDAYQRSEPEELDYDEWHVPYVDDLTASELYDRSRSHGDFVEDLKRVSAARCARVSYLTQAGERDPDEDFALYERLVNADPMHASPFEHVATPCAACRVPYHTHQGNLRGWRQFRHDFETSPYAGDA